MQIKYFYTHVSSKLKSPIKYIQGFRRYEKKNVNAALIILFGQTEFNKIYY